MKGVSLVFANTPKGESIMQELADCFVEERTLEEALIENHNLKQPSKPHANRNHVVRDFIDPQVSLEEIDARYQLVDRSLKATIKNIVNRIGIFPVVKRIYNWCKSK